MTSNHTIELEAANELKLEIDWGNSRDVHDVEPSLLGAKLLIHEDNLTPLLPGADYLVLVGDNIDEMARRWLDEPDNWMPVWESAMESERDRMDALREDEFDARREPLEL